MRQGGQLSPYLFVLSVEVLAVSIRQNSNIKKKNFHWQRKKAKLLQYADDTTAVLGDENSVSAFLRLLESFKDISGLKSTVLRRKQCGLDLQQITNQNPLGLSGQMNPSKT